MRVYLAGAINGRTDAECRAWRLAAAEILSNLGHEAVDPLRRDYRGREAEYAAAIVAEDKADIDSVDALIVNAGWPSWGTSMEVFYAANWHVGGRYHIVAFGAGPNPSPWLSHHVDALVDTLDQAIAVLVRGR